MSKDLISGNETEPTENREWFEAWFDSPYYDILYKHRDEAEAKGFIDALLGKLAPSSHARILDLACGKGRYSRYLATKGYQITALDLSVNSITFARQFEAENLSFFTHDMRMPFRTNYFDYIFNFFTSFGYFDNDLDHIKTLKNAAKGLKSGGTFVLDFFNSNYVVKNLLGKETKEIDNITFNIHKSQEGNYVLKTIEFEDKGKVFFFEERVQLLRLSEFTQFFEKAGLQIVQTFGNYQLAPFNPEESPRLILVAQPI